MTTNASKYKPYVFYVGLVVSLGGLLFGLDQGFMNGSLSFIGQYFNLSVVQSGNFASYMLWGSVFGSIVSGFVSRTIGRKYTLLIAALLFAICTFLSSVTNSFEYLTFYRVLIGVSVGVASFTVPLYLSEIAPVKLRGAFISMYQMMITVGILGIYLSNVALGNESDSSSWRTMFYPITVIAIIMLIGMFFVPKTPRFLALKKKNEEAKKVLNQIRGSKQEIEEEFSQITQVEDIHHGKGFAMLGKGYFWKVLILGIILQMSQQLTGINSVIYYSTEIFKVAGVHSPYIGTVLVGTVNMLLTIPAVLLIDKIGRKKILYFGYGLMIITLVLLSFAFSFLKGGGAVSSGMGYFMIITMLFYIFAFAVSSGPIVWVLCAEIFPLQGRDLGVAVTTTTNWVFAALVVMLSLPMMETSSGTANPAGGQALFLFFAICCVVSIIIIKWFVPETKGVSLETLEKNLESGKKLHDIGA